MTDDAEPPAHTPAGDTLQSETPMARALRLKKAAQAAKGKAPGAGKVQRSSAAMPSGASKPWMRK